MTILSREDYPGRTKAQHALTEYLDLGDCDDLLARELEGEFGFLPLWDGGGGPETLARIYNPEEAIGQIHGGYAPNGKVLLLVILDAETDIEIRPGTRYRALDYHLQSYDFEEDRGSVTGYKEYNPDSRHFYVEVPAEAALEALHYASDPENYR